MIEALSNKEFIISLLKSSTIKLKVNEEELEFITKDKYEL